MQSPLQRLIDWIEIESITGDEADYGDSLSRALAAEGFGVERQEVEPGRANVLARTARPPVVVFCTHLDTVPPFIPSRQDGTHVYGRGSCDAKGQAAAMLEAARQLLAAGEERIGFLFTVGEETCSDGAALANTQLAEPWAPRHVIIGEPTDNTFIAAHKGLYKARLVATGVAGHSSQDVGPSAIHELIDAAGKLVNGDWGAHPVLGPGTINIGQIEGGVAANVVADYAAADVLVRTVEEPDVVKARILACLGKHVKLETQYKAYGPVDFHVPLGQESRPVAFGTDAPHMKRWGKPLLFGCGSILDAHTDGEKVGKKELGQCVERHVLTVQELLAGEDS